jgi:hypothetical protein
MACLNYGALCIGADPSPDGNVILWVPSDRPVTNFGEAAEELPDKEHWRPQKMLQYVPCFGPVSPTPNDAE